VELTVGERLDEPILIDSDGGRLDRRAARRILRRIPPGRTRESVSMEPDATDAVMAGSSARRKRRWSDLAPRQQQAMVLGAIAELVMTAIAVADLARRPTGRLRGSKPLWFITFVVQPFGPILYLLVGRRRPTR
jgi:Phospholipase_D-nuclease N-terminal